MEEVKQTGSQGGGGAEGEAPPRKWSTWGSATLLDKTKEFFQTCDVEAKGFITRTDMRRLHSQLPLSAEELEDVFDSLDTDRNSYLTLGEFSTGFSQFLHGRRISVTDDLSPAPMERVPDTLYQNQWEERLMGGEEEEVEKHFSMLLDSLGASNVFEDADEVRGLWAQLRREEPHLLTNFEEFLARVTDQIKEAQQERKEMESALQRKAATHDSEIRRLYEEMELQIKHEKDRISLKDSELLQSRSQDLELQLTSKEKDLQQLIQKQWRLERQCRELSSEQKESRVENVKLKSTNQELSRELESTSQELALAQEQVTLLQGQGARLQQEREMDMYRVTEGLQREKQSLMKQLDLLREMNKHLKDERDISYGHKPRSSFRRSKKQRAGLGNLFSEPPLPVKSEDDAMATKKSGIVNGYTSHSQPGVREMYDRARLEERREIERENEMRRRTEVGADVLDVPLDGWPLRRVISIEEDHLPHLLHGGALRQLSEEDKEDNEEDEQADVEEVQSDQEVKPILATDPPISRAATPLVRMASGRSSGSRRSRFLRVKKPPATLRGQPVGKETQQRVKERLATVPDRLFKVVLVGNSSVGKTSLLRTFCEGRFHPATSATVGIDYSVKTLSLDNTQVAMQLWDTAGQERFRSITKQFFRKADGVVVMYDVTVGESFQAVRPWLENVQEAAGEGVPILLLGNKMDVVGEREVSFREADTLALDARVIFYEVSAYTGYNVAESLTHLARVLKDQEDRVRDTTVLLCAKPVKKKACCK